MKSKYCSVKWMVEFPIEDINEDNFQNIDGTTSKVQIMSITQCVFRKSYNLEWDSNLVEIYLSNKTMVFYIIVPKKVNGFKKLWTEFNYTSLSLAVKALQPTKCDIFLPKFKVECDYDFAKHFTELKVFKEEAEMDAIGGDHKLRANNVLHKVIFEVDSEGLNKPKDDDANQAQSVSIRADHPFLFLVVDNRTDALILIGKVVKL